MSRKHVFEKITNRKPPKPKSWRLPRGECRFCGAGIFKEDGERNKRRNWHPQCVVEWRIMNNPRDARAWVWDHYRGTCQGCDKNTWAYGDQWNVDHIQPLFLAHGDITYWAKENLTLLCTDCHVKKTRSDMEVYRSVADRRNYDLTLRGPSQDSGHGTEVHENLPGSSSPNSGRR